MHKTKLSPKYELTTYNPYREEFDVEWEGGVEKELQDLHFSDEEREGGADTEGRQISLDALRAYQWVQNERTRRRGIIAAGDLFDYHAHEEHDARTLANCGPIGVDTRIYQQCMTRDQYAGFLKALEVERTLLQRINVLKKLRMSGKRFLPEGVPSLDATRPKKTKLGYEPRVQDYSLLSLLEQEFCRKFGVTPSQYLTFKELLMRESELYGGVSEQRAIKLLQKPLNEVRHYLSHFDRLGLISRRKIPLPETPPPPPPQLPPPPQTAAATAAAVAAGAVIPTAMSPMLGTSRMHKDSKRHHKHKLKKHHEYS